MRKLGIDSRLGLAFGFPVALVLVMGLLSIQNIRDISDTTEMLYRHPFAVSRAMLRIDANIARMHRSMKDVVLAEDAPALNESARLVRQLESEVLQDLELVKERFLGDQNDIIGLEGLFMEWRPIREEVITLMRAGNRLQAAQITRDKGAQHVDRLSASAAGLLEFASVKADEFFTGAQSGRDVAVNLMVLILVAAVVVSILFFVLVSRSIPHITADRGAEEDKGVTESVGLPPRNQLGRVAWWTTLVCGLTSAFLGAAVVLGWHTESVALIQVLPSFVPMQYNTALGFLLVGIALLLQIRRHWPWSAGVAAVVGLIGVLTLLEYILRVNLGIDQLVMEHYVTVETSHPGRMAPNTALCFTLSGLGTAMLFRATRGRRLVLGSSLCGILVVALGTVALIGYLTGIQTAYGWANLTRMAVHTSIGFLFVGAGLIGISLRFRDPLVRKVWIPALVASVGATASLTLWRAVAGLQETSGFGFALPEMVLAAGLISTGLATATLALTEAVQRSNERLESRVAQRTEELDLARQAADAANLAKSEFLSNMSHELRTPLNGVLGYAQILQRDGSVTPKQRENLDAIESCGQHLLTLINDVLDLSKIEAGRLEVDKAPCDLHRLLKSVSDIVSPQAESKGLTFSLEVSTEVPRGILTDPTKLKQVLVNLAGNAVKFTDEGSVTLRVRKFPDTGLQLEVEDTGIGMTPEELQEIFDPFKQAEGGKKSGGTGLGLPISKRLVEALGGKLEVESQPGRGSSFIIAHPLIEVPQEDLSKLDEEPLSDQRNLMLAPGQDVTVLVADDRRENRDVLVQLLEGAGFSTVQANNGKEALEKLREHDMPLVFMDIRMPVMSGIEAMRAIRSDPSLKDKVIIAVSASVFPEFRKQATEVGFDDFIGKPFRVSEVFGKIKHHLKVSYTVSAQEIPSDSEQKRVKPGAQKLPPEVAREVARRVQEAVQLGNVSELTAVARELTQRADFTSPYGEEIARLAKAFDFEGLSKLASTLAETAALSGEKE